MNVVTVSLACELTSLRVVCPSALQLRSSGRGGGPRLPAEAASRFLRLPLFRHLQPLHLLEAAAPSRGGSGNYAFANGLRPRELTASVWPEWWQRYMMVSAVSLCVSETLRFVSHRPHATHLGCVQVHF